MKYVRKYYRRSIRALRGKKLALAGVLLLCVSIIGYAVYMQNRRLTVNPATYTSLLRLIAQAESSDNYNAYFGHGGKPAVSFTDMSIAQVLQWQAEYVRQGNPSNAVGRYQIISTTLAGLVRQLHLDTNQKFDPHMQDTLAMTLLERRGANEYVNKELTRDQFAANLAKEWAALPRIIGDNPSSSFYASDGLNKSRVSIDAVRHAIAPISPK